MTSVYILKLEEGKYYVGKSGNPQARFQDHKQGTGSAWTRTYKPLSIQKIIINASPFDEDKVTKEYMAKYGIDNVRGGSYVTKRLSEEDKRTLQKEIRGATDKCTRCGRIGHFVGTCYATTDVSGHDLEDSEMEEWECEYCDATFQSENSCVSHEKYCRTKRSYTPSGPTCYRCGHVGHYANDCYASRHVEGYYLDSDSDSD